MTGAASSAVFSTALRVNMTPQTVTVRTTSTTNNYGEVSYSGAAVEYDAYIQRVIDQPTSINVDETVEYKVFLPHQTVALSPGDQITLPSPVSGTRPIVGVETAADPLGQVGQIVYIGRVYR